MEFRYQDEDQGNDIGAQASIDVDLEIGTIGVGVYSGDLDGDSYTIYVPNHRAAILDLISQLQDVLDKTDGWPRGYDGFSFNFAYAMSTGEAEGGEDDGYWPKPGEVKWY